MELEKKSKVYFTKVVSPEKVVEMFKILNQSLPGNVAVKIHSGEKGNQNFLRPEFLKPVVDFVNGTVVETNSGFPNGVRHETEMHRKLLEEHGWTKTFSKLDLLDAEGPDDTLKIPNGLIIKENYVGKNLKKYDSLLVISRFKGHISGGFGGALKQLSIGCASTMGKVYQHTAGKFKEKSVVAQNKCGHKEFKEAMADAASSVVNIYRGKLACVTMMINIGVDCDCIGNAKPPCMKDIGILSSTDPVALDKACLDLIYNSNDPGKKEVIERIEEKLGPYIIDCSVKLGIGNDKYELINVD